MTPISVRKEDIMERSGQSFARVVAERGRMFLSGNEYKRCPSQSKAGRVKQVSFLLASDMAAGLDFGFFSRNIGSEFCLGSYRKQAEYTYFSICSFHLRRTHIYPSEGSNLSPT